MGSMKDLVNVDLVELSEEVGQDPAETADINNEAEQLTQTAEETQLQATQSRAESKVRGKKYVAARSRVDRTRTYELSEAVGLVKNTSYSKFDGTVTAHLNLVREVNPIEVTFPHTTGKSLRVAIIDDEILEAISREEINFDVLLATPAMMPKLARYARFLGPRNLMPNPKNGTVTTDPETKMKSLQAGSIVIRPEKKALLMHIRVGKVSQSESELVENIQALLKAVNIQNVAKLTLAATMGPGIKVQL
jgi:large subunit ribosomal protein L1